MVRPSFVACLVVAGTACSSDPASVYQLNGSSRASNAWSGAGSLCCDANHMENIGWQVWFTNTADCPINMNDEVALILVMSSAKTTAPSTQLPDIGGATELPIMVPPTDVTAPLAYLNDNSNLDAPTGTLTLTKFDTDAVAGSLTASGKNLAGVETTYTASFTAPACPDVIHD